MGGGTAAGASDEALLELALRDHGGASGRAAASQLLSRHQRRVYLWCRRYVREHEPAMDLAQEVLVSAYRALSTFQGRSRFSSWLFAITRNRCLNAVAAKRLLRDDTELDELPGPAPAPEAELELEQDEERVRQLVMKHLDEDEQRALWLSCFERLPVEEITRIMQLESASGARGLLQRARRRLRSALDRRDLVEEP